MASNLDSDDLSDDASREDENNSADAKKPSPEYVHINYGKDGSKTKIRMTNPTTSNIQVGTNNTMTVNVAYPPDRKKRQTQKHKRKNPITTSTEEPVHRHLNLIAMHTGKDWRRLGRMLNLSEGQLDNFKMQYHIEGMYEVVFQMLRTWKSESYPVTVHDLAKACDSIGRGDLADLLSND